MKNASKVKKLLTLIVLLTCILGQSIQASAVTSLRGESVYQIMVDRFHDGDPSNNATGEAFRYAENVEADFRYMHGGDWQGIIDKIPYLKEWATPQFGYHQYLIHSYGECRIAMVSNGRQLIMDTTCMIQIVPADILEWKMPTRARTY